MSNSASQSHQAMTSVLIGASRQSQIIGNVTALTSQYSKAAESASRDRILAP